MSPEQVRAVEHQASSAGYLAWYERDLAGLVRQLSRVISE